MHLGNRLGGGLMSGVHSCASALICGSSIWFTRESYFNGLLADENISGESIQILRQAGFSVYSIAEADSGVSVI